MITTKDNGLQIIQVEQAECLRCESVIPSQNIVTETDTKGFATTQTARAYCDHCGVLYRVKRVLRNGVWTADGAVEAIDDQAAKDAFLRDAAAARNEIQLKVAKKRKGKQQEEERDSAFARRLQEDASEPVREFSDCI